VFFWCEKAPPLGLFEGVKGSWIYVEFDWVTLLSRNAILWLKDVSLKCDKTLDIGQG